MEITFTRAQAVAFTELEASLRRALTDAQAFINQARTAHDERLLLVLREASPGLAALPVAEQKPEVFPPGAALPDGVRWTDLPPPEGA